MFRYQILASIMHGKIYKKSYKNNKFKIQLQCEMKNLNYQLSHILYQMFKIILSKSCKITT